MDHKLPAVKNLDRGATLFRQKGELLAVTWKDKKPVHLITTVPVGNEMEVASRKVKEGGVAGERIWLPHCNQDVQQLYGGC